MTCGQRVEGVGHEDIWGKGISGERHSPCKGLEAGLSKRSVGGIAPVQLEQLERGGKEIRGRVTRSEKKLGFLWAPGGPSVTRYDCSDHMRSSKGKRCDLTG